MQKWLEHTTYEFTFIQIWFRNYFYTVSSNNLNLEFRDNQNLIALYTNGYFILSLTNRILVVVQHMIDALKHPHPRCPVRHHWGRHNSSARKIVRNLQKEVKKQEKPDPTPELEKLNGIQRDVAPEASILSPPIQNHITNELYVGSFYKSCHY
jgi:hypothetical protein